MRIRSQKNFERLSLILTVVLFSLGAIWLLFKASSPERYELRVGDVSPVDIQNTRQLIDEVATVERAELLSQTVQPVSTHSQEISAASIAELEAFFEGIDELRNEAYGEGEDGLTVLPAARQNRLTTAINAYSDEEFDFDLNLMTVETLASLEPSAYSELKRQALLIAGELMAEVHDRRSLDQEITTRVGQVVTNLDVYQQDFESIAGILRFFMRPNLEFDLNATTAAREAAYQQALADPVLIDPGTRIVRAGEVVSETQYAHLRELDLLEDNRLDWKSLGSIALLYLLLLSIAVLYTLGYARDRFRFPSSLYTIFAAASLTIIAAVILARYSSLLIPFTFFAILCTTYYGLRTSLVMSTLMIFLFMPLVPGDMRYFFVAFISVIISSLATALNLRRNSFTMVIFASTLASLVAIVVYGLLFTQTPIQFSQDILYGLLSGSLSAVVAIGLMPIIEFSRSAVAPTRLITLSEPSNPLLKSLFLEAPGTHQHSMMVANLASAAAESIGANSLLCRVGAYYHDIGKLENPRMFTENQDKLNPHDDLDPEESYKIIIAHVEDGLRLARRYRLPEAIQAMIREHHGTSVLSYFYNKAKRLAQEEGRPEPDREDYRYPWNIPQSRETAILMLADSLEAAMKSNQVDNLEDMQVLARRILKGKNDEEQLKESGLSYQDAEDILEAFAQVYQGQFHERVRYSEEDSNQTVPSPRNA